MQRLGNSLNQEIPAPLLATLASACQGLTFERIRRVLSRIIAQAGEINELSASLILEEKKQIIQQSQLLEFCDINKSLSDLGGLDNFKKWLESKLK